MIHHYFLLKWNCSNLPWISFSVVGFEPFNLQEWIAQRRNSNRSPNSPWLTFIMLIKGLFIYSCVCHILLCLWWKDIDILMYWILYSMLNMYIPCCKSSAYEFILWFWLAFMTFIYDKCSLLLSILHTRIFFLAYTHFQFKICLL